MLFFANLYPKAHEKESPIICKAKKLAKKTEEQERPEENRKETKA